MCTVKKVFWSLLFFFTLASTTTAKIKGIYVTQTTFENTTFLNSLIRDAKASGINTFVVDLELPSKRYQNNVQLLKDNDIHYVARIIMFPDGGTPEIIKNPEKWQKKYKLVKEAVSYGAKEIQLDYIRYNTKQKQSPEHAKDILKIIQWYKNKLASQKIPLQIDVFGITSFGESKHIGQNIQLFSETVDAVCPMVYPSHYVPFAEHFKTPYETVYTSLTRIKKMFADKMPIKMYAYIELSNYHYPNMSKSHKYEYIKAQIRAVNEANVDGWYAWSPHNRYDNLFFVLKNHDIGKSEKIVAKNDPASKKEPQTNKQIGSETQTSSAPQPKKQIVVNKQAAPQKQIELKHPIKKQAESDRPKFKEQNDNQEITSQARANPSKQMKGDTQPEVSNPVNQQAQVNPANQMKPEAEAQVSNSVNQQAQINPAHQVKPAAQPEVNNPVNQQAEMNPANQMKPEVQPEISNPVSQQGQVNSANQMKPEVQPEGSNQVNQHAQVNSTNQAKPEAQPEVSSAEVNPANQMKPEAQPEGSNQVNQHAQVNPNNQSSEMPAEKTKDMDTHATNEINNEPVTPNPTEPTILRTQRVLEDGKESDKPTQAKNQPDTHKPEIKTQQVHAHHTAPNKTIKPIAAQKPRTFVPWLMHMFKK